MDVQFVTKWLGLDKIAEEEMEAMRKPVEIALTRATLYYEGRVKLKLRNIPPRTGRIYIIRGREHQASAPGEPPALLSGDLRKSITHTDVTWEGNEAHTEVGSGMPYARILEFGGEIKRRTKKGKEYVIRILPRPYFSATWIEEEAKIQAMLDRAVQHSPVLVDIVPEVAE